MYWYQNDHLVKLRELTSNSGNIAWKAVYQAWGNTVTVEWQEVAQSTELNPIQLNATEQSYLLQPHLFQGQIYDNETGLHYNRFRYYDPDAGRFISHDPIGLLGGDNNFQYAPNPVHWIDPWGLEYKRGTTRQIKREMNIPMNQHPSSQKMVPMTDKNGKAIFDQNHRPLMTRELTYHVDGKDIVIQDHSAGHQYGENDGNGDQPCHLNGRPAENTRNGKVEGMQDHYYFEKRNKK